MIRVKLLNSRSRGVEEEVVFELLSSVIPEGVILVVRAPDGERVFCIDGVLRNVYDLVDGVYVLTEVVLAVSEDLDSKIAHLERLQADG